MANLVDEAVKRQEFFSYLGRLLKVNKTKNVLPENPVVATMGLNITWNNTDDWPDIYTITYKSFQETNNLYAIAHRFSISKYDVYQLFQHHSIEFQNGLYARFNTEREADMTLQHFYQMIYLRYKKV